MYTIGIDPATITGVAVFEDSKLIDWFSFKVDKDLMDLPDAIEDYFKNAEHDILIGIEEQYLDKNVRSMIRVKEIATSIEINLRHLAKKYGKKLYSIKVYPKQWQTAIGLNVYSQREEVKKWSLIVAAGFAKMTVKKFLSSDGDQDIADAINIGNYVDSRKEEYLRESDGSK